MNDFMQWLAAWLAAASGFGLLGAGVYLLAGIGWALVVAALLPLIFAAVLFRGLTHAQ